MLVDPDPSVIPRSGSAPSLHYHIRQVSSALAGYCAFGTGSPIARIQAGAVSLQMPPCFEAEQGGTPGRAFRGLTGSSHTSDINWVLGLSEAISTVLFCAPVSCWTGKQKRDTLCI